ncbi:hypothetical protein AS28_01652, partial [Pygoscelis adeliae]
DILVDADPEGTDAERVGQRAHRRAPHVEIREDGAAELLVEGVDVGLAVGVVEGELPFVAVQLHPDPFQVAQRRLRTRRVGCPAHLAVLSSQAPRMGAALHPRASCIPARGMCTRVHACVRIRPIASLPGGTTHPVVFGDGLVGATHGPEILHLTPQGGLHVLQLGLREGEAPSGPSQTYAPRVCSAERQEPQ